MAVSKGFKWTAGIIITLIILIVAGYFILENYLENKIRNQLTNKILPEHRVSVKKVDVDLLYGDLEIDSLQISADSSAQSQKGILVKKGYIDKLEVSGVKLLKLLFNNKLIIAKVTLNKGNLQMIPREKPADSTKKRKKPPVDQILIKEIDFGQFDYRLLSSYHDSLPRLAADSFNFRAENLRFDLKDSLTFKLPVIKRLNADNLTAFVADDFYEVSIGRIRWLKDSSLIFHKLHFLPRYAKNEFSRMLGHQTDRIDIRVDSVYLGGINYEKFPDEIYHFRVLYLYNGYADIYRDKRVERPQGYKPPLPQQALRKLKTKVLLDTLSIQQGELHYYERVPGSNRAGQVYFDDLNMLILNITSKPDFFKVQNRVDFYATGAVMGQSLAHVHWGIPIYSSNDTMFFSGSFEDFDLKHLNEIVMPNEKVKIDRGHLNKLQFQASAKATASGGELIFLYDDLKISIFKKDEQLIKEQTLFSFIANTVLRTNNPPPGRNPLKANMRFERDTKKSAINFLWKSIFSGLKYTITPGKDNLERIKDAEDYFNK